MLKFWKIIIPASDAFKPPSAPPQKQITNSLTAVTFLGDAPKIEMTLSKVLHQPSNAKLMLKVGVTRSQADQ